MPDRRSFLQALSSLPWLCALAPGTRALAASAKRDLYKELGVRTFINAAGTYTSLTASLMPPEVVQAMASAAKNYVALDELHDAVGRRIASMIGCEAAMVTAGAASALTLGTAAAITGKNPDLIHRIPDLADMKNEVIIQKSHRYAYDHAVRNCGVKLVEVETRQELEHAVNDRTALMLFFNAADPTGKIKQEEFVELGRKHHVPTFNDAAADVPPVENLSKYIKMGFDLVTFSGGKGLRGPQSTGLLLGRKDLVEAARLNDSPNSDSIGRGMKVNKEELLGMMVALELYLKRDHAAEWREWEKRVKLIAGMVGTLPGVTTEVWIPEIANHVPHLKVKWDTAVRKTTVHEVARQLREGQPSIEVVPGGRALTIGVWMMRPGDAQVVGRRLKEVLQATPGA
jgi:D-glucosaminate-6-phosphate ammonia-lyase